MTYTAATLQREHNIVHNVRAIGKQCVQIIIIIMITMIIYNGIAVVMTRSDGSYTCTMILRARFVVGAAFVCTYGARARARIISVVMARVTTGLGPGGLIVEKA